MAAVARGEKRFAGRRGAFGWSLAFDRWRPLRGVMGWKERWGGDTCKRVALYELHISGRQYGGVDVEGLTSI